jgi:beta-lactamase superfamily II metal-dependent hydrolase
MPNQKPTSKKKTRASKSLNGRQVKVRMYNVGFGDAFLVTVPTGDTVRRILFDCGSLEAAPGVAMKTIVEQILCDATDPDGAVRIDVVVATHRHKDHVSGFGQAGWDDVSVREVWMPWTEDPSDSEARRIRDVQSRLALALNTALTAMAARLNGERENELKRYREIINNSLMLSNEKAMKTLHGGFAGNPKRLFLPQKSGISRTFETEALPGMRVHILGPSRSADVIRDMDPPQGKSFLRLQGLTIPSGVGLPSPFTAEFRCDNYDGMGTILGDDLEAIKRAGSLSELAVAVALDKAVNGTSLMLMLEIAGTYLLFPGDAQWGTWKEVMKDPEWREMLSRVSFYKIGHHGSHNATPKDFVLELIPDGIYAMASTLTRPDWADIPKPQLLAGLVEKKAHLARSDKADKIDTTFVSNGNVIEARIPF